MPACSTPRLRLLAESNNESSPSWEAVLARDDESCVGDRGLLPEHDVAQIGETRDVSAQPAPGLLVPVGQLAQQLVGALLVTIGGTRTDTSHRAFGLADLALDVPAKRGPRGMAMLSRNRAL